MAHSTHLAAEPWSLALWPTIAILLLTCLYLRGWLRVRSNSTNALSFWQASSFLSGLLLIWFAVGSPLAALDMQLLTAHMVQHLLLMTFAPPLILLGSPWIALSYGLPRSWCRLVESLFAQASFRRFAKILLQPAFCWFAGGITLIVWHIPAIFTLAMHSERFHAFEQFTFFAAGLLFWWPVVRAAASIATQSGWSILVYLFLATVPCDILSAFLVFSERVAYPVYSEVPHRFGISVLADQQCAAALMWTCVTVVYLVPATILTLKLLSPRAIGLERSPNSSFGMRKA